MNPTQTQIKNLDTYEKQQMRRYQQSVLRRISKRRAESKNQYEQEQDFERNQNAIRSLHSM